MVDKIIIDEKASTGGADAIWARESTLQFIANQTKSSTDYIKGLAKNKLSTKELEAIDKDSLKATKQTNVGINLLSTNLDKNVSMLNNSLLSSFRSVVSAVADVSRNGLVSTLSSFANQSSASLKKLSAASEGAMASMFELPLILTELAVVFGEVYEHTIKLSDQYQKMYENGINFTSGLSGMTKAAGDLGISTSALVETFNQFSSTVTYLGVDKATKLAKQFTDLNRISGDLGLTNEQAANAVLEYSDMLRTTGQLAGKTNDELVKGAKAYYEELNLTTYLTGKNRKELQKEIDDRRKNPDFNLALANLPREVRENVKNSLTGLSTLGPTTAKLVQDSMGSIFSGKGPVAGIMDKSEQLIAGTNTAFQDIMQQVAKEAESGEVSMATRLKLVDALKNSSLAAQSNLSGTSSAAASAADMITQMNMENESYAESQRKLSKQAQDIFDQHKTNETYNQILERLARDKSKDQNAQMVLSEARLGKAAESLMAAFNTLLAKAVVPLTPALILLADGVTEAANGMIDAIDDIEWIFSGLSSLLSDAVTALRPISDWFIDRLKAAGVGLEMIIQYITPLRPVFDGITSAAGKVISVFKTIGGWFFQDRDADISSGDKSPNGNNKTVISRLFEGGFIVAATVAVGKILMRLGGGVLSGGGRILSMLGSPKLLSMLGSPRLLGVGGALSGAGSVLEKAGSTLSGSIRGFGSLIGDAVVGVSETLGKSSEGLKTFIKDLGAGLGQGVGNLLGGLITGIGKSLALLGPEAAEIGLGAAAIGGAITLIGAGIAAATWLEGKSLPTLAEGLKAFDTVNGENLKSVGLGMAAIGAGLLEMGASKVINAFGDLMSKVLSLFGVKDDPIEKFKKFGELAEPIGKVAPIMKQFADSWTQALTALNGAKIDDSVTKTIENLSNILFIDNKAGYWSGKVTTASKVQELADSIGSLAAKTADLQNAQTGASTPGAKLLSPSDLQKKTIDFYTDQKQSIGSAIGGIGNTLSIAGIALSGSIRGFGSLISDTVTSVTGIIAKVSGDLKTVIVNISGAIGKGAGELVGGLMTGLAAGFKAFASGPVLIGAGIFAAAIAAIGAGIAGATWIMGEALPNLAAGLKSFENINGANLKAVGIGMAGIGAGILALGAADVISAFGGLMKSVLSLFGIKNDPIEKFKRFGELAEPLNKVAPAMKMFSDAWTQTLSALNSAKIDDSVTKTINDLSNILFVDNKAGFWSGKVSTASKVQELADSIGSLAARTSELQSGQSSASTSGAKLLSPSDLQKKTIDFYTDQKQSNASLIQLLQMVNSKLDTMNDTFDDGTDEIVDALKKVSGKVF